MRLYAASSTARSGEEADDRRIGAEEARRLAGEDDRVDVAGGEQGGDRGVAHAG
ncbi:MAG: hypothetical protein M5U08_07615 [Burkholderiales bacterium]|nr:hypothetical protein [Burkholderiales bacterium]